MEDNKSGKSGTIPTIQDVKQLKRLTHDNQLMKAWQEVQAWAPLEEWQGHGPLVARMGASLLSRLGGTRASDRMDILNSRHYPEDDQCFLFGQFSRLNQFGGIRTLPGLDARLSNEDVTGLRRAELLALKAVIYGNWEDFETAIPLIDDALALCPDDSWLHSQKSVILVSADRYRQAEEEARHALELRSGYTPAVMQLVQCLTHNGRDDEAIDVLLDAHDNTENGAFAGRLQGFFSEREDHQNALKWLDEYVRLMPLLEKGGKKWVASRRCDFVYMAGDYKQYVELSDKAGKYHKKIAKRLREPGMPDRKRKRLDVPFIRQHNMTCAPATLAAISRYFGKEHDHLDIAEAICYDGTPWHKERKWAEDHGFVVHEFRVTREIVIDLIDRGIPFTLTTSWATGAHLQACIGYDDRQGVILLRDPTHRHFGEMILDQLIEKHPVDGPRGMAMVPHEKSALLDGVEFPDKIVYDARNDLMLAIDHHNRVKIMEAFATMRVCAKDHPMLLSARLSLALYDRDASEERRVMDEMIERFPDDPRTQLRYLYAVQKTEGFSAQQKVLQSIIDKGKSDPVFYSEMGEMMLGDVAMVDMAQYYLHKAVRFSRYESRSYASLSRVQYQTRDMESALLSRRIAACLNNSFEPYSRSYFDLCVELGRVDEGLDFLRGRVARLGDKNSGSWITLVDSLESLSRDTEAREVLKQAREKLPNDGELMMTSVEKFVGWGKLKKAYKLLDESRDLVTENRWCREMARAADTEGNRAKAIRYWKRVIELEDGSVSAQRNYTRLIADEKGVEAAISHMSDVVEKYPDREDLLTLYADWLIEKDVDGAIKVMEKAVELAPNDTWNLRELANYRARAGDFEGAIESALLAVEKNPRIAESHGVLGGHYFNRHRYREAADSFREAVSLNVDYGYAIRKWIECAVELGEIESVLGQIRECLRHQVTDGTAVTSYREAAYQHVAPDVLLGELKEVCVQRPDLWESWFALKQQQLDMSRDEEALETAKIMVEKFPLIPRVWAELADVYRVQGKGDKQIKALEKGQKMSPSWDWLARKLTMAYEAEGRFEDAITNQQKAIEWNPRLAVNYGVLADILWKLDRKEEALNLLCDGLEQDYYYGWGWDTIGVWGKVLGKEERVNVLLEKYRSSYGHQSSWWQKESGVYADLGKYDQALEATDKGLECDPEDVDLHVAKAFYLSKLGRIKDAMDATDPSVYAGKVPRELLARRAWLLKNFGHGKEAEKLLIELTDKHPDFLWPLRELLNYRYDSEDWEGVIETANGLIRLDPDYGLAHGWLGDAHEKLSHQEQAIEAFEKALAIEPSYSFAAYRLGVMCLNLGKHDKLRAMLPALEYNQPGGMVEVFKTQLHCAEGKQEEALVSLRGALREPDLDSADINGLRESFEKAGWLKDYIKTRDNEVAEGRIKSGSVLSDWVIGKRVPLRQAKRIHEMAYPLEVKENAWAFIMSWIVDERYDDDAVKLVKRYPELAQSTYLWGQVCWMLTTLQKYAEVIDWMMPLQKRDGMEDWMLYNLTIAMSSLQGADAARVSARFALQELEPDEWMVAHAMAEALMTVKEGDEDAARTYLKQYGDEVSGWSSGLKILTNMVLSSHDREKVKKLWKEFTNDFTNWKTNAHHFAYVTAAKQAFKARKAKWPGSRFLMKPKVESSSSLWWKLILVYLAIRILISVGKALAD